MSKAWKEALQLAALGVGVTMIGLVVGAFLMSPGVSRELRLMAIAALGGAAGLVLLFDVMRRVWGALRMRRSRRRILGGARHTTRHTSRHTSRHAAERPASAAPPAVSLRTGRPGKTPRTVQALAAAGALPTEIARKTGLPLDAVSMLLEIHGTGLAAR